ncbi:MAG: AMP-binding protein [Pseudomonadota bacterium]
MSDFFDALETRDPAEREAALLRELRSQISDAMARSPGMARHLAGIDAGSVTHREALAMLPVLRKSDLVAMQKQDPPFGGLTTRAAAEFDYVFQSPGPIYEPGMQAPDWWRFGRALYAGGLRADDIVINCFAYHLTPAGAMFDNGARAVGATVLPGGIGNTEAQVTAAADMGATAYAGTPDFLKVMMEKAAELGRNLRITKAIVGGGPLFPQMRQFYIDNGISCVQGYGTADLGNIAYETPAMEGMTVDEGAIVEIVRPGTGDPVPDGEVGEVIVTILNPDYPLIRFATGDMSAVLPGPSPCGRTNMRIKGWMGRADQTTKVKGMFVRPEQIAEITKRHPEIIKARLTVDRSGDSDVMTLTAEGENLDTDAIESTMRDVLKLRGSAQAAAPGSLANDGKIIDDIRKFD